MSRTILFSAARFVLLAIAACLLAACALTVNAGTAHALFTTDVHTKAAHAVKPFPVDISVDVEGYEANSKEIDRKQITVTITYSDGSKRVLTYDEFDLTEKEFPSGHKGPFDSEVVYEEGGHTVSLPITVNADAAYGAQYGNTLVFGRGIPADTYEGAGLTNTTWTVEKAGCSPLWNKNALTRILDIDTVKPVSIINWFNYATSVRTIVLDQMDTSALTTLEAAFRGNTAMTTLNLTGWNTSNVQSLFGTFRDCSAMTSLQGIGDWDVSRVQNAKQAFAFCGAMTTFDVSRWNLASATTFEFMFVSDFALTSLNLSNWNTSSCVNMACMFYMYPHSSLQSVGDLSNWNVSRVNNFASMFAFDDKLTGVGNLNRWNVSSATSLSGMFQFCKALTNVGSLNSWNVSKVGDFSNMFQYCENLTTVGDISGWNTSSATNMFQMFQYCKKLTANCSNWNVSKVTNYTEFNGNGASGVTRPHF